MDEKFYLTTNILNILKSQNKLVDFFKNFAVNLTEFKGLDFIELFDYKCKYNANKRAYEVYCGVAPSRYIELPKIYYKFLINDYYCYLLNNNKQLNISKFWQAYCKTQLSPNLLELWQKGKDQKGYYNIFKPIKKA